MFDIFYIYSEQIKSNRIFLSIESNQNSLSKSGILHDIIANGNWLLSTLVSAHIHKSTACQNPMLFNRLISAHVNYNINIIYNYAYLPQGDHCTKLIMCVLTKMLYKQII